MFTYTIGRNNIINFHRCRCVSNAILSTCTNVTDNGRLNKINIYRKRMRSRIHIVPCFVLSFIQLFLLEWGRKKTVALCKLFLFLFYTYMYILLYKIVAMKNHFEWCMMMYWNQMKMKEIVDVMEAVCYFDYLKMTMMMMMKEE